MVASVLNVGGGCLQCSCGATVQHMLEKEIDREDRDGRRRGKSCRATKYTTVVVTIQNSHGLTVPEFHLYD
ncbi:hypothetical protein TSUD_56480 [Trifolium subterraneum]|uniref:Uncharacterized protein n=1 Tax=Trifolium subterraneum TaxID=3900 RepID=A0A2Z6NWB2_TRISU|nr:hypothetical protein TSUD_56480 [Trifolium subterraneum]